MPAPVLVALAVLASVAMLCTASAWVSARLRRPPSHVSTPVSLPPADASAREVDYLERMVAGNATEPVVFRVGEVLLGPVTARRAVGLCVDVLSHDELAAGVPDDLATVMDNLLHNAHVHGRGRGVVVETTGDEEYVEVVVRDAGPGVPADLRPALFRPGSRAGSGAGNGLGLHISRNLLRAQGGDLELRDTARGAAFVARIPAQRQG